MHDATRSLMICLILTLSLSSAWAVDTWPQYGGPNRDFVVATGPLAEGWPATGPTISWRKAIGTGYSGIVGDEERLYTLYRDGDEDVVLAMDRKSGETLWTYGYPAGTYEGHDVAQGTGPNATPLLAGTRLLTLAYDGKLHAFATTDGSLLWSHDLVGDFGAPVQEFGHSNALIQYRDQVLVPVGGAHGVIAFRLQDGSVVWRGEPSSVSYAAPVLIQVQGKANLVYFATDAVIGMDPEDGRITWQFEVKNQFNNHASPAMLHQDNLLWVASQLASGTRALRLTRDQGQIRLQGEAWFNDRIKIHYWNAVRFGDGVLAVSGDTVSLLSAINMADGRIMWRERGFSPGNLMRVNQHLILLDEEGVLHLLKARSDGVTRLAQHQMLKPPARTAPALIGTTLYLRDHASLIAVALGKEP